MSKASKSIDVKILDKEMRIACVEDEQKELLEVVDFLDKRMRHIRDTQKIASIERIALMAALNISHELLGMRVGRGIDMADVARRMSAMQVSIDQALAEQDSLF